MATAQAPAEFTEQYAVWALARWFGGTNMLFPNVHLCGGEMDLAIVTAAGYLWEVEIKRTVGDWRKDEDKRKWQDPERRYVTRFFYAVPPELEDRKPDFVPDATGLLIIDGRHVRCVHNARRRPGPKLDDQIIRRLLVSTYHRFWNERRHRHLLAMRRTVAAGTVDMPRPKAGVA